MTDVVDDKKEEDDGAKTEPSVQKDEDKTSKASVPVDKEVVEKYVEERVNESLKNIKSKLDTAFAARDEALRKIAEYEAKEREAEVKRLKDEGKEREAYELQLAAERTKREALEKQNTELTRDVEVRGLLNTLQFRNDKAVEMAYKEIVSQLVRDENNVWVHRSGIPVNEYVKLFSESDDNAFLFRTKASSGSGNVGLSKTDTSSRGKKSLFEMPQEEVLKLAAEGKLRK